MRIPQLPELSAPKSSHLFAVSSSTNDYKIDYNKLAKAIIEQYAGSSLGGSARSIKAALDNISGYSQALSIPFQNSAITFSDANQYYKIGSSGLTVPAGKWLIFGNFMETNAPTTAHQKIIMISESDSGGSQRKNTLRHHGDVSTAAHYQIVMFLATVTQETVFYPWVVSSVAGITSTLYALVDAIRVH